MKDQKKEVVICPTCKRVNQDGDFKKIDTRALETIRMSQDRFVIIDGLCSGCTEC